MTMVMPAGLEEKKYKKRRNKRFTEKDQATSITVSRIDNGFNQA